MDLLEAIRERRSIRKFAEGETVKEEDIRTILEAARLAPSDANSQPWHFIVVRDSGMIKRIGGTVHRGIDRQMAFAENDETKEAWHRYRFSFTHFENAPLLIAVLYQPTTLPGYPMDHTVQGEYMPGLQSVGAAINNMLLMSTALGYQSCWMTGPVDSAKKDLEDLLEVKNGSHVVALISFGLPTKPAAMRPRKSLEEIATFIG